MIVPFNIYRISFKTLFWEVAPAYPHVCVCAQCPWAQDYSGLISVKDKPFFFFWLWKIQLSGCMGCERILEVFHKWTWKLCCLPPSLYLTGALYCYLFHLPSTPLRTSACIIGAPPCELLGAVFCAVPHSDTYFELRLTYTLLSCLLSLSLS